MKNAALTAIALPAIAFATSSFALEPKQCLPMAEMNAALKADGQRTLIIGNRSAAIDAPERASRVRIQKWMNAYTSNADGSLGFNIEGDKPMGEQSSVVCVRTKFKAIQLYDAHLPGTPAQAKRGPEFDESLKANELRGIRPMLQALSVSTAADGSIQQGNGITLFGDVNTKAAYLVVNYPGGKAADLLFMQDTDYTPTALARLQSISDGQ